MTAGGRPRYDLALSALGAVALAVCVFLPWYEGATSVRGAPATKVLGAPAAVQVILLVLAGLALTDALFALARTPSASPAGAGASVALLGALAAVCVAYRILDPPRSAGGLLSGSLREGAWLALLSSLAMVLGGLRPRVEPASSSADGPPHGALGGLPGWTPGS